MKREQIVLTIQHSTYFLFCLTDTYNHGPPLSIHLSSMWLFLTLQNTTVFGQLIVQNWNEWHMPQLAHDFVCICYVLNQKIQAFLKKAKVLQIQVIPQYHEFFHDSFTELDRKTSSFTLSNCLLLVDLLYTEW